MSNMTLTAIEGIRVGHAQDAEEGLTGCTVVLCPPNTIGGVDQRGGAPGTRETDLLRPMHLVQNVNAVFLAGGSAYGLAVGDGVMRYLEGQGLGYRTPSALVPIVPGAILYDLNIGSAAIRPSAAMGYSACELATADAVAQGSVGAGTGATVGKLRGKPFAMKGGIGSAALHLEGGVIVAALIAVNAAGDVVDAQGQIMAGMREDADSPRFRSSLDFLRHAQPPTPEALPPNTVIGVVATNARLNKEQVNKLAQMAQDGIAQAVRPAHLPVDGDTLFGLATGTHEAHFAAVGAFAAEVTAQAIRNAVQHATALDGVPALQDLHSA